ncbi:MAG: succinate dehydrogenase/fumarate reductase iron-sulfur subunit, partial [Cyclobacteriaceae bacterium]|nr:succinate dehydrogenase/fumarate reductase iron-sulfur subunit [Cyclobacteriaceae bacterium]
MNLTLKIWRQTNNSDKGGFKEYKVADVSKDMSFLEMLDVLNEQLSEKGEDP